MNDQAWRDWTRVEECLAFGMNRYWWPALILGFAWIWLHPILGIFTYYVVMIPLWMVCQWWIERADAKRELAKQILAADDGIRKR
jgi:hypothetical protein